MALPLPVIPPQPDAFHLAPHRIKRCTFRRLIDVEAGSDRVYDVELPSRWATSSRHADLQACTAPHIFRTRTPAPGGGTGFADGRREASPDLATQTGLAAIGAAACSAFAERPTGPPRPRRTHAVLDRLVPTVRGLPEHGDRCSAPHAARSGGSWAQSGVGRHEPAGERGKCQRGGL